MSPEIKPEIVKRQEGYGTFEVPLGLEIFATRRLAAKFAATENLEMRFRFNEKDYAVSPEQAKEILTPENIRGQISRLEAAITSHQRMIKKYKLDIEEERQLGGMLYGEDFNDKTNAGNK
ncbi:hypothetical protein A3G14_01665 [Candidatus Curtissbacteria bacterium RIFCSPLOWO2_12_FULL_38_9]|uniref:Uncharacterized protein n=2 Tax=Candidatus Curtissiibacteriota TaxID=1752717 RepID=A0A1F5G6R9_9BACT|nr:MAG: hypothetical protein A3D04_04860 [Candidatus Curtissbacteria bacterium RIFCSPHIGHO2_02_FULL_40_16b]OGE13363.1 MAG: hypothetical protein A3G14_01665 [Candidatus Curtissbacteria bacterium RIFCSPLOWO2_12_FULL_38_9]